jgi:hypothetical protein
MSIQDNGFLDKRLNVSYKEWLKNIKFDVLLFVWAFYITRDSIYCSLVNAQLFSVCGVVVAPTQIM